MEQFFNTLWFGIREPFKKTSYIILFFALFLSMLAIYILIPVWTVTGNALATQLDIFNLRDYLTLALLSSLSTLFITMQIYAMRYRRKAEGIGATTAGGLGALFAGIAGTASCASCLAPLFAFLGIGFGGVVFVLEYRWYFVVTITIVMLVAIYLTARKIKRVCISC